MYEGYANNIRKQCDDDSEMYEMDDMCEVSRLHGDVEDGGEMKRKTEICGLMRRMNGEMKRKTEI